MNTKSATKTLFTSYLQGNILAQHVSLLKKIEELKAMSPSGSFSVLINFETIVEVAELLG